MKAMLMSEDVRSSGASYLLFEIDEDNYNDGAERSVTRKQTLNGSVVYTDFGFKDAMRVIQFKALLPVDDYETAKDFQEDSVNNFLFAYKNACYRVYIKRVTKSGTSGSNVIANVLLWVRSKLLNDYAFASSSSSSRSSSSSSSSRSSSSSSVSSSSSSSSAS